MIYNGYNFLSDFIGINNLYLGLKCVVYNKNTKEVSVIYVD
jgi:hypothetical protein